MADKVESLNIYQKLAKIRKQVEVIQKDKAGFNYKYVSDDEIMSKLSVQMDKYNVSLIPSVVPGTLSMDTYHYVKTKKGNEEHVNEILVKADMVMTWVNNDNPEDRIEVPWVMTGQQADASQAVGSGLTYNIRYFYLKYFGIATPEDDPDNWRTRQKNAEVEEDKAIAMQIVKQIDEKIKEYVSSAKDGDKARDAMTKLCKKYVKTGNYNQIADSKLAAKLLQELNDGYFKKESK